MAVEDKIINRANTYSMEQKRVLRDAIEEANNSPTLNTPTLVGDVTRTVVEGEGELIGSDFGWRDLEGPIDVRGTGANDPTWSAIGATGFHAYKFAIGDECWFNFHVPHDYVPGSNFHIHTHWLADGTNANIVKWSWDLAYSDGYATGVFPFATPTTVTAESAAAGTAYTHMITETVAITGTGVEVDGIIMAHITRVTNGGTDNTDGIFLLTSDIHYQSTGLATKNRNKDFYT